LGYLYADGTPLGLDNLVAAGNTGIPSSVLDAFLKKIYDATISDDGTLDQDLFEKELEKIFSSFERGFGKTLIGTEFGTPNWEYLQNLKHNTAVFAAFKQNTEIKEAHLLLFDDAGNKRTWREFRQAALSVCDKYNQRWLKTEYNQAHQTARMAAKWKRFEEGKDLYPNLVYVAVMDERTRESHAKLNGTVRPIDDPFWDIYYPPNGWGCRCSVRATDKKVTEILGDIENMPSIFKNNPGKTAEIFSQDNPYAIASAAAAGKIKAFASDKVKTPAMLLADKAEFDAWETNADYIRSYFSKTSGGYYISHKAHNFDTKTGKFEKKAMKSMADKGYKIMANAERMAKTPDLTDLVSGRSFEIKTVVRYSSNSVMRAIQKGLEKSDNVILCFSEGVDYEKMRSGLAKFLNNMEKFGFTRTGKIYYINDAGKLVWFADV
jgi:SPP1 gp7 family putative phage head morphogenesis protein